MLASMMPMSIRNLREPGPDESIWSTVSARFWNAAGMFSNWR
jgi:hypothetical protein